MKNTKTPTLAPLSDQTIDRMEQNLLLRIESEPHSPASARTARAKRQKWMTVSGVAAAFVVGVLVAPPIINAVSLANQSTSTEVAGVAPEYSGVDSLAPQDGNFLQFGSKGDRTQSVAGSIPGPARDIIASARASVRVNDVAAASHALAIIAGDLWGYVEAVSMGQTTRVYGPDAAIGSEPILPSSDWGSVSIRVPSSEIDAAVSRLSDLGEVTALSRSENDVTTEMIDLRARTAALQTSVERLTDLMAKAESISEVIAAESALSERQSELESYQQQLSYMESQVAMSTLYVELQRIVPVTQADPSGFTDGVRAGWDGLMVSVNALVLVAGFAIPWLAVAGVIWLIVWLIVRRKRAVTDAT